MGTKRNIPKAEGDDNIWQAVYMDLITMLMIVFLLMWVLAFGKTGKGKSSGMPFATIEIPDEAFRSGETALKKSFQDGILSQLSGGKDTFLEKLGYDEANEKYYFINIHGHTDHQGSHEANLRYGYERAVSVYKLLSNKYKNLRTDGSLLRPPKINDKVNISVCSHSYSFPVNQMETDSKGNVIRSDKLDGANRRVNITGHIIPKSELNRFIGKKADSLDVE